MNSIKSALLLILVSGLLIPMACGLALYLDKPSLAFSPDSPLREKVMRVVTSKQFKFLGGHLINASTTLDYAGDSAALNAFLDQLAKCEGAKVGVSFSAEKSAADWTLDHNAWSDESVFNILVHTARIPEAAITIPKQKAH